MNKNNIIEEISLIASKISGINDKSLNRDTKIASDLRLDGDDVWDLINEINRKYPLNFEGFNFEKYFTDESKINSIHVIRVVYTHLLPSSETHILFGHFNLPIIMKRTLIILLLASVMQGCTSMEPLTLKRENYNGRNLRLDGYYYTIYEDGYFSFFLYKNGVYLNNGVSPDTKDLKKLDTRIIESNKIKVKNPVPFWWGVFIVNGSDIKIEEWLTGSGGAYPTRLVKGKIINDTTLAISGLKGKHYENQVDYFHFRQFSPKPDSTNNFIK